MNYDFSHLLLTFDRIILHAIKFYFIIIVKISINSFIILYLSEQKILTNYINRIRIIEY